MFQACIKRVVNCYSNIKLTLSKEQQAAFLTLSKPQKRNPLSLETIQELHAALIEIRSQS